tara:strand:- start:4719 stop:5216 length:498 start_codon:yes stop_codon:yes gene_type:complete
MKIKKQKVFLQLGSNIGDRVYYLNLAKRFIIDEVGSVLNESRIYESAPWGVINQDHYLNEIIEVNTVDDPHTVLKKILNIEKKIGRVRKQKWSSRVIDIDIIFYTNFIINKKNLIIPHEHMHKRNFVLLPLNEIAADFLHPIFKKTVNELMLKCTDKNETKVYKI